MLKQLFDSGLFSSAKIEPVPTDDGKWLLILNKYQGGYECVTKVRDNENKVYKTRDGALKDAELIGFKEVSVILSQ